MIEANENCTQCSCNRLCAGVEAMTFRRFLCWGDNLGVVALLTCALIDQ